MFVYILELLNREGHLAFFELQKGGRKANNAQKEKRRLARKRSRASKRERDREAAKVAQLPPRERECLTCGRKFKSRKTAKKHKCARHSKVVRKKEADASGSSSQPAPLAQLNKPAPPLTPLAPTAPTHSRAAPSVTGDLRDPPFSSYPDLIPAMTKILAETPTPSSLSSMEDAWVLLKLRGTFESAALPESGEFTRMFWEWRQQ
ncbi:hypothetical protein EDB83DRAFT_2533209 [Lactarius deliciosus]|nr:hypothetical protein EDB83DRAFT_2533209 [Lactarius deliciosus]